MPIDLKIKEESDGMGGTVISFDKEALMNATLSDIMRDVARNQGPLERSTWDAVEALYRERLVAARQERNQLELLLKETRKRLWWAIFIGWILFTGSAAIALFLAMEK